MTIFSEADRQNFIFDGSNVEKGSRIKLRDGSGSGVKLGILNYDYLWLAPNARVICHRI